MSVGKIVWSLLSLGLAYGVNIWARPQFDAQYDAPEYSQQAGTLTLNVRGDSVELPLMASHIVTADVERMGRTYQLRELTLRAADGGGNPKLELFASLAGVGELAGGARDPGVLLQREIPLARTGRLGARPAYVVLGAGERSEIVSGSLMLTDVTQTESGERPAWNAMGRIEVQLQTSHGIDMVTGKWTGRLVWDPDTTSAIAR